MVELTRTFHVSAAHALPEVPSGHKCGHAHGHNFEIEVAVRGETNPQTGFLMDYGELKRLVAPVIARLDHRVLNEIPGLENPTSEILSRWLWEQLEELLPGLFRITIRETPSSSCSYWGEA